MSAFICTDLHFSVIANETKPDGPTIQQWADYLKAINIESVNYRYKERTRKSPVKLHEYTDNYSVHDIAQLLRCYLYQSCEKDTMAFFAINAYFNGLACMEKGDRDKSSLWSI